jgi:hypothetical protein
LGANLTGEPNPLQRQLLLIGANNIAQASLTAEQLRDLLRSDPAFRTLVDAHSIFCEPDDDAISDKCIVGP